MLPIEVGNHVAWKSRDPGCGELATRATASSPLRHRLAAWLTQPTDIGVRPSLGFAWGGISTAAEVLPRIRTQPAGLMRTSSRCEVSLVRQSCERKARRNSRLPPFQQSSVLLPKRTWRPQPARRKKKVVLSQIINQALPVPPTAEEVSTHAAPEYSAALF